eukprot:tig00000388_g24814.t1
MASLLEHQEGLRRRLEQAETGYLEQRIGESLEREYAARLDAELSRRDQEISYLKGRLRSLELESAQPAKVRRPHVEEQRYASDAAGPSSRTVVSSLADTVRSLSFGKYIRVIAVVQLLICFLTALARADIYAAVVLIAIYACHEKDKAAMGTYIILTLFSIVADVIWLGVHADTRQFAVTVAFKGTMAFVFAMSILGMLFKVLILWPAYEHYKSLPVEKPSEAGFSGAQQGKSAFDRFVFGALLVQFAAVFLIATERADIYALVLLIAMYSINEKDKSAMRGFFLFAVLSLILDVVWLALHRLDLDNLQSMAKNASATDFVFGMTIVNMLFKLAFAVIAVRIFTELPQTKPSDKRAALASQMGQGAGYGSRDMHAAFARFDAIASKLPNEKALIFFAAVQLVLCCFESLARWDVFAVVVGVSLYAILERDKIAIDIYMGLMAVSLVADLIWFGVYSDQDKFLWRTGTVGTLSFVIAMAALSFVLKLVSLVPALYFRKNLPDKPSEDGMMPELGIHERFQRAAPVEKLSYVMYGFAAVHLVLFFVVALERLDPFGVVILALLYGTHEYDRRAILGYMLFMDLSLVFDCVWLVQHKTDLNQMYAAATNRQIANNVAESTQIVYAATVIHILFKFAAHIPAFLYLRVLPETKPSEDPVMTSAPVVMVDPNQSVGYSAPLRAPLSGTPPSAPLVSPVNVPTYRSGGSASPATVPLAQPGFGMAGGQSGPNVLPYVPVMDDKIDEMMALFMNEFGRQIPVKLVRQGPGIYLFGTRRVICKILNDKLVARVGGGYMLMDEFVETYGAVELEKVRQEERLANTIASSAQY